MSIDLTFFKETITNFVVSQHTKEEIDQIVNKWKETSYNLIKELGDSNCGTFFSYQVFIDNDCNIDSLLYLTSLAFLLFS